MENLFWIGFVGAALAGGYALLQTKKVLSFSEGTSRMKQIAGAIREGANAYLHRQYKTVLPVFAVIFVILTVMAFASGGKMLSKFTPFAFLTGGIWSLLAGFIGMKIATHSNARTAQVRFPAHAFEFMPRKQCAKHWHKHHYRHYQLPYCLLSVTVQQPHNDLYGIGNSKCKYQIFNDLCFIEFRFLHDSSLRPFGYSPIFSEQ